MNRALEYLSSVVLTAAEEWIPWRSASGKPRVPWWSPECTAAIRDKKRCSRRFHRTGSRSDFIALKCASTRARRVLRRARRSSWRAYVSSLTSRSSTSLVWRRVGKISRLSSKSSAIHLRLGEDLLASPAVVGDVLGYSFAYNSSGSSYSASFAAARAREPAVALDFGGAAEDPYNVLFSAAEFWSALSSCRDGSPGPDGITYPMIRHLHPHAVFFLQQLFLSIWISGDFPDAWRRSLVVPIPKPGKDLQLPGSFRPISLTCCLCKLMERMVYPRLLWFLEHHSVLSPFQFGFRRFRSTTEPLLRLDHDIREAFSRGDCLLAVFFDLEKAYDSVWRGGLFRKLHSVGLRGALPIFIRNLFSDRSFSVRVGSTLSRTFSQVEGVPQGSVLSVLCFALAFNDVVSALPPGIQCSLYVDDFAIYVSGSYLSSLERRLQLAINAVVDWADLHGFRFSESKSVALLFHRWRSVAPVPSLFLRASRIRVVEEARFLGLLFDKRLTWAPHIRQLRHSCHKPLDLLRHLSHTSWGADRKTLLRLYKSLVLSKLDYGSSVYSSAAASHLRRLDPLQSEGLRLATGAFRSTPIVSLHVETNVPPLSLRRRLTNCKVFLRLRHLPDSPLSLFRDGAVDVATFWPFARDARELLASTGLPDPTILPFSFDTVPPWIVPSPPICTYLSSLPKSSTLPVQLRGCFQSHALSHSDSVPVYTDGSKSEDGVGCAAVFPHTTLRGSLPSFASIYTAELFAIYLALQCILGLPESSFTIFSDSRSALAGLGTLYSSHPWVLRIHSFLMNLHARKKSVAFCWVPSHVGIPGNELADAAAKAASLLPPTETRLPYTDYIPAASRQVRTTWRIAWDGLDDCNSLRQLKDSPVAWPSSFQGNRRWEVVLARLRLGHTRLTHGHYMSRGPRPLCPRCDTRLTVRHILVDCPRFAAARSSCFPFLPTIQPSRRLSSILGDSPTFCCDRVISFLRQISLLADI